MNALVVHGSDGLDELTLSGPTHCASLKNGEVRTFDIAPEEAGLSSAPLDELKGGDSEENARITRSILSGKDVGPKRDVVVLNAAAALLVADRVRSWQEGVALARTMIENGAALDKLEHLIRWTQENR